MHVFPFTKQIQSSILLKKYCENKVIIKMTCSVVNTVGVHFFTPNII